MHNKKNDKLYNKVKAIIQKDACMTTSNEKELLYLETDVSGAGIGTGLQQLSALTHIMRIRRNFDVANLPRYRAGFDPMLFQWCYSHMAHFSSRIRCDFFTARFFRSRPLFIARFLFCRAIFHVQTDWALLFVLQLIALLFVFPIDNTYETDAFQRFYRSCEFSNIAFGSISIYTPL